MKSKKSKFHEKKQQVTHCILKQKKWNRIYIYTDQNYKRNTFVFAPIFHELNSKI